MTIGNHAITFEGRDVVLYDVEKGVTKPQGEAYALRSDWGDQEAFSRQWDALMKDPNRGKLEALILGAWDEEMFDASTSALVELLKGAAGELTSLEAVFFPDVIYEECEISWLQQSDVSPVLEAYPKLKTLRVRGGEGLSFHAVRHEGLRRLIVETGGLASGTVAEICALNLPNLEHLELWLGSDNYGGDATVADLAPILSGKLFPKLTSLGLMNSEFANDIALNLAGAPILEQIKTLDLSMGTMTDEGAEHLLNNPALARLERLDVSDNFISDAMSERLRAAWDGRVYVDGQKSDDGDGWFYASVTE